MTKSISPGALRAASALFETQGFPNTIGNKTHEEWAKLIDESTGLPELLEALKEWAQAESEIERYLNLLEREQVDDEDARWMGKYERAKAAISKSEGTI